MIPDLYSPDEALCPGKGAVYCEACMRYVKYWNLQYQPCMSGKPIPMFCVIALPEVDPDPERCAAWVDGYADDENAPKPKPYTEQQ